MSGEAAKERVTTAYTWVPEEGAHGHVMHALRKLSAYLLWENVWENFQIGSPFS